MIGKSLFVKGCVERGGEVVRESISDKVKCKYHLNTLGNVFIFVPVTEKKIDM